MRNTPDFLKWQHHAVEAEASPVFPDGCRDVLIIQRYAEPVRVVLTEYDTRPRRAELASDTMITGYRLRPGVIIKPQALEAVASNLLNVEDILGSEIAISAETDEAVQALGQPGSSLPSVSRQLGVSSRTLQRRFRALGLPPPDYWRQLTRARQAVRQFQHATSLTDIAHDCGYSDQAHMTRECVRWFGLPPAQLRRKPHLLDLLIQPALGNWTGEQISTR